MLNSTSEPFSPLEVEQVREVSQEDTSLVKDVEESNTSVIEPIEAIPKEPNTLAEEKEPTFLYQPDRALLSKFPKTDIGNAEMFAYWYKGILKYDHSNKQWLIWDGVIWRRDEKEAIYLWAKAVIRARGDEARHRGVELGRLNSSPLEEIEETQEEAELRAKLLKEVKEEIKYCWRLEDEGRVRAMLRLAKSEKSIRSTAEEWDSDINLLGVRNGVVDLRTGELIEGDSRCRVTKQARYKWISDAELAKREPTLWNLFLHNIFEGMEQAEEVQEYVSRFMGYCCSGYTHEHCLITMLGIGDNGKSILLEVMRHALGDYSYSMPFSTLELKDRSQLSNDVATLHGKRMVVASEVQENVKLNEARIKNLTGDEAITARFLNREFFTFKLQAKFWLAFNHKPTITDDSFGFWKRFRLLNLPNSFKKGHPKRIEKLQERLIEEEGEVIFNWMLRYCKKWYAEGLGVVPSSISKAVQEYRIEENPLSEFVNYRCAIAETREEKEKWIVKASELYDIYVHWCRASHIRHWLGKKNFTTRMNSLGFTKAIKTQARVEHWLCIRLKTLKELDDGNVISEEGRIC